LKIVLDKIKTKQQHCYGCHGYAVIEYFYHHGNSIKCPLIVCQYPVNYEACVNEYRLLF